MQTRMGSEGEMSGERASATDGSARAHSFVTTKLGFRRSGEVRSYSIYPRPSPHSRTRSSGRSWVRPGFRRWFCEQFRRCTMTTDTDSHGKSNRSASQATCRRQEHISRPNLDPPTQSQAMLREKCFHDARRASWINHRKMVAGPPARKNTV